MGMTPIECFLDSQQDRIFNESTNPDGTLDAKKFYLLEKEAIDQEFNRIHKEKDKIQDKMCEAIGWMYAEACASMGKFVDIREVEFPEIIDRMSRELDYDFLNKGKESDKPEEPKFKEVVMYQTVAPRNDMYPKLEFYIGSALFNSVDDLPPSSLGYKPVTVYLKEGE